MIRTLPKTYRLAAPALLALAITCGGQAHAQGGQGQSRVQISDMNDIPLGTWSGYGSLQGEDDVCVWSGTGGYNLTASSQAGGAFLLQGPGSNELGYSVFWAEHPSVNPINLVPNQTYTGLASNGSDKKCRDAGMARLIIHIPENALAAALAGSYAGVLQLTVAAE